MSNKPSLLDFIDTLLIEKNFDIIIGFIILIAGTLLNFVNQSMGFLVGLFVGGYFAFSLLAKLGDSEPYQERKVLHVMGGSSGTSRIQPAQSAPVTDQTTIADRIKTIHVATGFKCPSCGVTLKPTDMKCSSCGSFLVATADLPQPARWGDVEVGQRVRISHPSDGPLDLSVKARVYYGELWQAQMRPNVPWTLTGNYFVALELDTPYFLINWQERYFLTTSYSPLTDYDIQTYFAPYARKFAESNQTADVRFYYAQTSWHIDDIGKFRIEYTDGKIAKASPGSVGRFIHASDGENVLIVEDYESGGKGMDTIWFGIKVEEKDIKL